MQGLTEEGYQCITASNGIEDLDLFKKQNISLLLLDWMMPKMKGIEVCKQLQAEQISTPIIFLTAKDTVEDTIEGLKTGANDYMKKPFNFDELLARIETHIRLYYNIEDILKIGSIAIHMSKYKVIQNDEKITLT